MDNPDLQTKSAQANPETEVKTETRDKRSEAQAALAGAEWTEKREREAKVKELQAQIDAISKRLVETAKEKEKLELGWIELDNQRRAVRTVLNPLLDEEKRVETEEIALEIEEGKTGLAADKQVVEKKRWAVQDKRKEIERKKWAEEEKLAKIEKTIQENTTRYRAILDEEEKAGKQLEQLKLELAGLNNQTQEPEQENAGQ